MDNLPIWALWPITLAVGVSPGLAVLSARPIARLIYHVLGPRPKVMREPEGQLTRDEPAGAAASRV
jgi:hypothetical protein